MDQNNTPSKLALNHYDGNGNADMQSIQKFSAQPLPELLINNTWDKVNPRDIQWILLGVMPFFQEKDREGVSRFQHERHFLMSRKRHTCK
jgi:hypothetical protein